MDEKSLSLRNTGTAIVTRAPVATGLTCSRDYTLLATLKDAGIITM